MPKEIIKLTNVTHSYADGNLGINDINLSICRGEFIILAGKNGSGKTTLLRHLNGLILPSSGSIHVNGLEVSKHLVQTRRSIGMVFQDADTQIVSDTVFDEVAFGLENLKESRSQINQKVTHVLKELDLYHLKNRNPSTLSGGEKRKLAIAGVLVMGPEVIVFDEPFSNLDYPGSVLLLKTIVGLNNAGHTIIVATHDIETIICDSTRIIILENGQIKEDGPPQKIVTLLESYGVKEPCSSKLGLGIVPCLN
jgi:biotin transport system ATP-binding protein